MPEPSAPSPQQTATRRYRIAIAAGVVAAALASGVIAFERHEQGQESSPTSNAAPDDLDRAGIPCDPETKHPVPAYTPTYGCRITRPIERNGLSCRKDSNVEIYEGGALRRCWLSKEVTLDGTKCKDDVTLTPAGRLRRCQLAQDVTVDGVTVPAGAWLTRFDNSGKLKRIESLDVPVRVDALSCVGPLTFFHEQGGLARCTLAEATTLAGESHRAGEALCLDAQKKPVKDCSGMSFELTE